MLFQHFAPAAVGWLDIVTGDYSLIIFYQIPVSIAVWFVSKYFGILFCFLAVAVRIVVEESSTAFYFSHSTLHYWNELIEFLFLLIMSVLFSALKTNLENEKTLSSHDPLTGALNCRSFFDLAEYEVHRSHRYDLPLTVAYIDLDRFKEINDNMGHKTGDEVLVTVVSTIKANIRNTDILARFGGDEFVILLPATSGIASPNILACSIAISVPYIINAFSISTPREATNFACSMVLIAKSTARSLVILLN